MPIVGCNYRKITLERKDNVSGNINIKNNIAIKDVEEKEFALGKAKQQGLKFNFEFTTEYEPNIGTINILGEVLFLDEPKKVKELAASWKKNKKLEPEVMQQVLNTALNKCNVKALILSEDINLPPPIPLPRVNIEKKGDKTDKSDKQDKSQANSAAQSYIG
ncbi:hypothetical protein J4206_00920 [Candidatus Woesearchaeota archaeon]|nr:hypothetical protein [Candidatus Woesearchaeota archaeon]